MKILSLQHIAIEDPGTFKDFLLADGLELTTVQLDEGDSIPKNLNEFDAMLCMGGPMDTFMEKEYPWLVEEKKAIGDYVLNLKKPFLGFCLGCQLLGEVLGGIAAVGGLITAGVGVYDDIVGGDQQKKADAMADSISKNPQIQVAGTYTAPLASSVAI